MGFLTRMFFAYGLAFLVGYIAGPMAAIRWARNPYVCLAIGTFLLIVFSSVGGKKKS